jgi:diguanylate cyclase (GGDEF)-like protein
MLAEIKTIIVKEKEMSRTDFLTGISNARNFYELAEFEIKRAHRQNDLITIAYMDIDDFKRVNDTKGHMEGDLLLQTTADIIKTGTRQTDIIARLGGDEFVALMPAASGKQAQIVLERIRTEIHDTFKTKNWDATISIGAATCSGQNCSVENLIKSADCLMYEAKEAGKNRLVQRTIETVPVCSFKEISPAEQ